MSEHRIKLQWERNTSDFAYDTYNRTHEVRFEGGKQMEMTAAPQYKGEKEIPNPEELFAASLSSCHMLTFLAIAAKSAVTVDSYEDEAVATLAINQSGKLAVKHVLLQPRVKLSARVSDDKFKHFHDKSHATCFIANAVRCEVTIKAQQV